MSKSLKSTRIKILLVVLKILTFAAARAESGMQMPESDH